MGYTYTATDIAGFLRKHASCPEYKSIRLELLAAAKMLTGFDAANKKLRGLLGESADDSQLCVTLPAELGESSLGEVLEAICKNEPPQ